jgi:hypothetical protein
MIDNKLVVKIITPNGTAEYSPTSGAVTTPNKVSITPKSAAALPAICPTLKPIQYNS